MKKLLAGGAAALAIAALGIGYVVTREPATPKEQLVHAEAEHEAFLRQPELAGPELETERDRILGEYRKVFEKFPPGDLEPKARKRIAELMLKWERFEAALDAHRGFAEKFPEHPAAPDLLWTAADLALRDDPAEARRLYRLFADRYPDHARAAEALAELARLMAADDSFAPDEVRKIWQELLDKHPKSAFRDRAMLGLAEFYKKAKAYEAALRQYDKVIEEFEGKEAGARALLEKGRLLAEKMNKKEEAKKTLDELEKKFPKSEFARRGSGMRRDLEKDLKEKKAGDREDNFFRKHYGMPAGDLFKSLGPPTQLWARILKQKLDLQTVAVKATVDPAAKTLEAVATIRASNGGEDRTSALFQLHPSFKVSSVTVNGSKAEHAQNGTYLKIGIPGEPWKKGDTAEFIVTYAGGDVDGLPMALGKTGYAAPGAFWHPITVYGDLVTGSLSLALPSGNEIRATGVPGTVTKTEERWTHAFEAREPVFGLFFAYGPYRTYTKGRVTLSTVTEGFPHAEEYVRTANDILDFYTKSFGPLPWTRIDLVEAELPPFIGGISPANVIFLNTSLMGRDRVPVSLLAHEIAHQWWGNLVPVAPQHADYTAWLSEGLSCYADALYLEHAFGAKRMEQHLSKAGLVYLERMLDLPDVPIAKCWWFHPQYHAVTYMKGAVAFHLLRQRMGAAPFAEALRTYARDFKYTPGGKDDFRALCEKASGKPLKEFFDQWILRGGFPRLRIERVQTSGKTRVSVRQEPPLYTLDLTVAFEGEGKREERPFRISKESETLEAAIPFKIDRVVLDPRGVVLKHPGSRNEWKRSTEE